MKLLSNNVLFYIYVLFCFTFFSLTFFGTASAISIETDKETYTWTDTVEIFITAPEFNKNDNLVEYLVQGKTETFTIKTSFGKLENYPLVETTSNSGIFHGRIILTGDDTDQINLGQYYDLESWEKLWKPYSSHQALGATVNDGPLDGKLASRSKDTLRITFQNLIEDVTKSIEIKHSEGKIEFEKEEYNPESKVFFSVLDSDMNLNYDRVDNVFVLVWSENDPTKKVIDLKENGWNKGEFSGLFTLSSTRSGFAKVIHVSENDLVHVLYLDITHPEARYKEIERIIEIGNYEPRIKKEEPVDPLSERKQQLDIIEKEKPVIVPSWIKNIAKLWSENQIGDSDFKEVIKYLIQERIIKISAKPTNTVGPDEIPTWIKNNVKWWSDGIIDDAGFVGGIEYLVERGIIRIE